MFSGRGSRYSSGYMRNEYEFNEDSYEEHLDDRDNYQHGSDEDMQEVECDTGNSEEYKEIKEQIYQDELGNLKRQLQELKDGNHPVYNRKLNGLDEVYKERLCLNTISRDYMIECVERDCILEKKAAVEEFEKKKAELLKSLISDMEKKCKVIVSERHSMELTGDSKEIKPVMTRELRRRPNNPVPVPRKCQKTPPGQLNLLLDEEDIELDLESIRRGKTMGPIEKITVLPNTGASVVGLTSADSAPPDIRIAGGKLLYKRRWYHRGQPVCVEGKGLPRFPAVISAITGEIVWVKKTSDDSKVRISLTHLTEGKISMKCRAS